MLKEGPALGTPVPEGSTIICPGCGVHISETLAEIASGSPMTSTALKVLIHPTAMGQAMICPKCDTFYVKPNSRYLYLPPPSTMGDRIINFMYWDANYA